LNIKVKAILSKINFKSGRNPVIKGVADYTRFIPEPYKAVVIFSADFELAWAWRYTKSAQNPLQKALDKAKLERENIPRILALCEQYYIPVTWFTVGHLFLENCEKIDGIPHPELPRPPNFENDWWRFEGADWFEHDPCTDYKTDPLWYCPDLIEMILGSKVNHEIGCHTFSHIDCRDNTCTSVHFQAEIEACIKAAMRLGIANMRSFVHPAHAIGNLDTLAKLGFTSYRSNYANILGYPKKHKNGIWEFEQTADFVYRKEWSVNYHIFRYIEIIKRAIKSHTLCYYWFHPSFDAAFVEKILPEVFKFINDNRNKIWVTTHSDYVRWLTSRLQYE
jgi:peptidoglycan/xylan/chitin deacetylase (PgdA/CDA1 family)